MRLCLDGSLFHKWKITYRAYPLKATSPSVLKRPFSASNSYTKRWRFTKPRVLWFAPVIGLGAIYFYPKSKSKSTIDGIFSSPDIIPCQGQHCSKPLLIQSPYEDSKSFWKKMKKSFAIYILEPVSTVGRFLYLCLLFVPVLVTSPMLLVGSRNGKERLSRRDRIFRHRRARFAEDEGERWGALWWYEFLVRQMQKAGPTFIKVRKCSVRVYFCLKLKFTQLAQWAGSRTDLFPDVFCEKTGTLHSNVKPHSLKHTKRIIEKVFGRPFDEVFEEFDEIPIGVGAIAQVSVSLLCRFFC